MALPAQFLAQAQHLTRVAQVDGDHGQPVQPLLAARLGLEAPHGVVREAAGHQKLRAVAEHHQGQLEADLHATAGEQRAATREVGGQSAAGGVVGGAGGAEAVVERIDLSIGRLADIATARLAEDARVARHGQRRVLAPVGGAGRGGRHRVGVRGGRLGAPRFAAAQPSVAGEGRGDLLGAQPHGVVDGQLAQPADRAVEGGQLVLVDHVTHASPPPFVPCRGPGRIRTDVPFMR